MANWKKIIVSGSGAHLASVTASNLTATNIVSAGTGGLITNSGLTLNGGVLTGNSTSLVFSGGSSVITGSFTGSFTGDGSGLTGTGLDIDALNAGSVIVAGDKIVYSDDGTEKSLTFAILSGSIIDTIAGDVNVTAAGASTISNSATGSILSTISGDVNVTAAGVSTIQSTAVEGTMLNSNVADGGTIHVSSNTLSVLKVPNALSFSNGIGSTGDFDGSSAIGITVDSGSLLPFFSGSTFDQVSGDISITSAGVASLANNISITSNLTVGGDLTVNGTTTTLNTANLLVEDRFILLNSGSANPDEGGIIVDEGGGSGSAYIYDASDSRWGFNANVSSSQATANSNAYAAQVIDENNSAHTGAVSASYVANGNIRIATNGDIFIYS